LIDPLVAIRAVHYAATTLVAGAIFFELVIASTLPRLRIAGLVYGGLAVAVISGAAWLMLFAAELSGHALGEVLADDTALVVLTQTRFGTVWTLRLACSVVLAVAYPLREHRAAALIALASAALLLGAVGFAGHSGAAPGTAGAVQLAADVLHLLAAGGWLGALVPLAMLLAQSDIAAPALADVTRRFSSFGVVMVATLAATGLTNAYLLVGSPELLVTTPYGQVLLAKIVLFAAMVALAAVNRLYHLPQLGPDASTTAVRGLFRNSLAEIALGLGALVLVGLLGTLPPALHAPAHIHMH
jgi:putative copper resistance protein D